MVSEIVLEWPLNTQQSRHLLEFCLRCGVDCFSASFLYSNKARRERTPLELFDRLSAFGLAGRVLERTVVYAGQDRRGEMECWSLNRETMELILDASGGSLSNYEWGLVPEDWTFYRNWELFLGFVSHERFGFLRLSEGEVEAFRALGIGFRFR